MNQSFRTVFVLWLRQIKRHFRSKPRVVGSLVQPILFLVALGFGMGPVFRAAGQGNYIDFLAPGIIGMAIIFSAMFSGIEVIWDRQFGFLKETLAAPVSRFDLMLGRTMGSATVATFQGVFVFLVSLVVGFRPADWRLVLPAVAVMFLVALLFAALGTSIASRLSDMQGFQLIMNFLIMPLFFLSGAMFPLDEVPAALALVARFDPLTYGVDAFRGLFIGSSHFGVGTDILVISVVVLVFLGVGSYSFSRMEA